MNDTVKLHSPKTVARMLDCSLSQVYKEIRSGDLVPDFKLFGESARGFRFSEESIKVYLLKRQRRAFEEQDEAPTPFIPVRVINGRVVRRTTRTQEAA